MHNTLFEAKYVNLVKSIADHILLGEETTTAAVATPPVPQQAVVRPNTDQNAAAAGAAATTVPTPANGTVAMTYSNMPSAKVETQDELNKNPKSPTKYADILGTLGLSSKTAAMFGTTVK